MLRTPTYYTARQLSEGPEIPAFYGNTGRLVYSSPATLAYNSPGAEGFGVKRAGLAVPGSVMLIVSPGCCGRNTSAITDIPGYRNRFFYLVMSETDLVTGRHLKRIPEAAVRVVRSLKVKPSVLMICITCVDALLGTDMERIARRAEEACGIPVRPCYMYALTREGRRPPMVHVRESIYSLLTPKKKVSTSVNLMGFFAPLMEGCELRNQLRSLGVRRIREISTCQDIGDFYDMAEANFNLVLNPEVRPAAEDLWERLKIPYIELTRLYQIDQIERQTMALGKALGYEGLASPKKKAEAEKSVRVLKEHYPDLSFAVGEACNANPFELSLALLRYGFHVPEIFGTPSEGDKVYLDQIASLSPETKIYSNMDPSMVWYGADACRSGSGALSGEKRECDARSAANNKHVSAGYRVNDRSAGHAEEEGEVRCAEGVQVTIGKDASFYHPEARHVYWNSDVQPYGYAGVRLLFNEILEALERGNEADEKRKTSASEERSDEKASFASAEKREERETTLSLTRGEDEVTEQEKSPFVSMEKETGEKLADKENEGDGFAGDTVNQKESDIRGFRRILTPFSPDQSGAEAVLFHLGGMLIIVDAGGCTGNICGFDEPRWGKERAAVFSAGLRDMDAIMGRDTLLAKKAAKAQEEIEAKFLAYIGTPVPAVIGTDYQALARMTGKKTSAPVFSVNTNGFELYDKGEVKAYQALFDTFAEEQEQKLLADSGQEDRVGILGLTPLEVCMKRDAERIFSIPGAAVYGASGSLDEVRKAGEARENLAVSPAGVMACRMLQKRFGTPYRAFYPLDEDFLSSLPDMSGRRILIVHQQVLANALREALRKRSHCGEIKVCSWFMMLDEGREEGDAHLDGENDFVRTAAMADVIFADPVMKRLVPDFSGTFISLPHFAVSGRMADDGERGPETAAAAQKTTAV